MGVSRDAGSGRVLDGERVGDCARVATVVRCGERHNRLTGLGTFVREATGNLHVTPVVVPVLIVLVERAKCAAALLRRVVVSAIAQDTIGDGNDVTNRQSLERTLLDHQVSHSHVGIAEVSIRIVKAHIELGRDDVRHEGIVPTGRILCLLRRVDSAVRQNQILCSTRARQVGVDGIRGGEVQLIAILAAHGQAVGEHRAEVRIQRGGSRIGIVGTSPRPLAVGREHAKPSVARAIVVGPGHRRGAVVAGGGPGVVVQPRIQRVRVAGSVALDGLVVPTGDDRIGVVGDGDELVTGVRAHIVTVVGGGGGPGPREGVCPLATGSLGAVGIGDHHIDIVVAVVGDRGGGSSGHGRVRDGDAGRIGVCGVVRRTADGWDGITVVI